MTAVIHVDVVRLPWTLPRRALRVQKEHINISTCRQSMHARRAAKAKLHLTLDHHALLALEELFKNETRPQCTCANHAVQERLLLVLFQHVPTV